MFDIVDIGKAKEALDGIACVAGTMPMDLLTLGTPQDVKDHVKKCIDVAGKDGAYMMANGAFFDNVPPENIRAMVDFTKEYGVYK